MLHLSTVLHPSAPRRRSVAVAAGLAATALVVAGIPGSAPAAGPTSDVSFISIPAKAILNNGYVGPNATTSVVAIGGSTTVPSDATTVRIDVTVKGAKAGTLKIFPAGLPTPFDSVSWAAGTTATATVQENIGLGDKISVTNVSAAAATVTLKITGFSTQVTSAGVNGSAGVPGEVLTNTGAGAAWAPAPSSDGYSQSGGSVSLLPINTYKQVATLSVPSGSYWVMFTGDIYDYAAADNGVCYLESPVNLSIDYSYLSTPRAGADSSVALQGLMTTASGGTITVLCNVYVGNQPSAYHVHLTAVTVGHLHGFFASASKSGGALPQPGHR